MLLSGGQEVCGSTGALRSTVLITAFVGQESIAAGSQGGVSGLGILFNASVRLLMVMCWPCFPTRAADTLGDLTGAESELSGRC